MLPSKKRGGWTLDDDEGNCYIQRGRVEATVDHLTIGILRLFVDQRVPRFKTLEQLTIRHAAQQISDVAERAD